MNNAVTLPPQQAWLEAFVTEHQGVAGTVHQRTAVDDLELVAALNIPPPVQQIVARVPRGKGMAGLAYEKNKPISTCNIKTDSTGQVRPGARAVNAQAAVALPVVDAHGQVRAVVGIAFHDEKELSESELVSLGDAAASLPV